MVTVLELPVVARVARGRVADAGLAGRVAVEVGDAMAEPLPAGHDVFLVANLVHYWSPEANLALLCRVRTAAEAGSRLLLADFGPTRPTPSRSTPPSWPRVRRAPARRRRLQRRRGPWWLGQAGWRFVEHASLAGPQSLIVAVAV